ncbi:MAG: radical SAM family heme chaperone HemW [Lachnospiraceae bacterium]|nr:radical SAM family heme chaperone HemW [Lachnospiraceae bacterium]
MKKNQELELYLHIPFCKKKCAYCDFLSQTGDEKLIKDYISALQREIKEVSADFADRRIISVFFGGGTPSILPAGLIDRVMDTLRGCFSFGYGVEITIECNPGTLTREKLAIYKNAGINRLSMGVQSANDRELAMLGRIHSFRDVLSNYELARNVGFSNISMDLISGLPQQSVTSFLQSLRKVVMLKPEHISVYSLQIEEGTKYYDLYHYDDEARKRGDEPVLLPSEDAERAFIHESKRLLEEKGYRRYEISNYARKGFTCRHNVGYWKRKDYLGLGLGASSLIGRERFKRTTELAAYLKDDFEKKEKSLLTMKEEMSEMMFLGLRMDEGVSRGDFYDAFGISLHQEYGEAIEKLKDQGLLLETPERVYLSERGFDLANVAMAEFV